MGQVEELVKKNPQAFFWGLAVAVVLLVVMYLRRSKEGMTAGGLQDFDQGYFGGSGHEGYAARRLDVEGVSGNKYLVETGRGNGTYVAEGNNRLGNNWSTSDASISAALAAENSAALRKQLGCKSANHYSGVSQQYLDKSNSGNGWVAREGMAVDDQLAKLL